MITKYQIGYPYVSQKPEIIKDSVVLLIPETEYVQGFQYVMKDGQYYAHPIDNGPKVLENFSKGVVGRLIEEENPKKESIARGGMISGEGISMQLALILAACSQYNSDDERERLPLILFSAAIERHKNASPFLDSVITTYCNEVDARKYLPLKYRAAKMAKAIAFIIPQRDAEILAQELQTTYYRIDQLNSIESSIDSPVIVGVKKDDLVKIAENIGVSNFYFSNEAKSTRIFSPIIGLPLIYFDPKDFPLNPFPGARSFEKKDAPIFWGRESYIKEIYTWLLSKNEHQVGILYGQSGAGKSSFLKAGVLPYLRQNARVHYKVYSSEDTLLETLQKIFQINHELTVEDWKKQELDGMPFIVILDQVERIFKREDLAKIEDFFIILQKIFIKSENCPAGKIILSFQKEYYIDINKRIEQASLCRTEFFLDQLNRREIITVITNITQSIELQKAYHLEIEENLATKIADDLLQHESSPITRTLQLILFKMWQKARESNIQKPRFTLEIYNQLKKEGLLEDFLQQQIQKIEAREAELVQSGLILDMLYSHTDDTGALEQKKENLRKAYQHVDDSIFQKAIELLKEESLLFEPQTHSQNIICLAHDSLAISIRKEYRKSNQVGQKARRLLESHPSDSFLDKHAISLVKEGKKGMRDWNDDEKKLIRKSADKILKTKQWILGIFISLFLLLSFLLGYIFLEKEIKTNEDYLIFWNDANVKINALKILILIEPVRNLLQRDTIEDSFKKAFKATKNELLLQAIVEIGKKNSDLFLFTLFKVMQSNKEEVAGSAAKCFGLIGNTAEVKALELINNAEELSNSMIEALGYMQDKAKEKIPILIDNLNKIDETVPKSLEGKEKIIEIWKRKEKIIEALGKIGEKLKEDIEKQKILNALKSRGSSSKIWFLKKAAIVAISKIQPEAIDALEELKKALDSENWEIKKAAMDCLVEIGNHIEISQNYENLSKFLEVVQSLFDNKDSEIQMHGLMISQRFPNTIFPKLKKKEEFIKKIVSLLESTDIDIQEQAMSTLAHIGNPVFPILWESIQKGIPEAVETLTAVDIPEKEKQKVLELLKESLNSNNEHLVIAANWALFFHENKRDPMPRSLEYIKKDNEKLIKQTLRLMGKKQITTEEEKQKIYEHIKNLSANLRYSYFRSLYGRICLAFKNPKKYNITGYELELLATYNQQRYYDIIACVYAQNYNKEKEADAQNYNKRKAISYQYLGFDKTPDKVASILKEGRVE